MGGRIRFAVSGGAPKQLRDPIANRASVLKALLLAQGCQPRTHRPDDLARVTAKERHGRLGQLGILVGALPAHA